MVEKLFNHDNLNSNDIDEIVIRTKAVIINSKNEILLGYSHGTYQFPGGHLEENETLNECLKRELKEEIGVDIDIVNDPYLKIVYYSKNYRGTTKNRENDIYYFLIKRDIEPDTTKTHLDEFEKEGNYITKWISLGDIESVLKSTIKDNSINEIIVDEMIYALKGYLN